MPETIVVFPLGKKKPDEKSMAEQLEAWNGRGEYAGRKGVFDYDRAGNSIIFRPGEKDGRV